MINANLKRFFQILSHPECSSAAILIVRLIAGIAFIFHGWGKIQNPLGWMPPEAPVPGFLQFFAALSEFGGGIAWILGLVTPLASLGIGCTMAVAVFMHGVLRGDPFVATGGGMSYELALVYLGIAILIFVLGPGKFSLDSKIFGNRRSN